MQYISTSGNILKQNNPNLKISKLTLSPYYPNTVQLTSVLTARLTCEEWLDDTILGVTVTDAIG